MQIVFQWGGLCTNGLCCTAALITAGGGSASPRRQKLQQTAEDICPRPAGTVRARACTKAWRKSAASTPQPPPTFETQDDEAGGELMQDNKSVAAGASGRAASDACLTWPARTSIWRATATGAKNESCTLMATRALADPGHCALSGRGMCSEHACSGACGTVAAVRAKG